MKKMLSSLLGAGLVLLLAVQACGPEPVPVPPQSDGGSWVECDGLDAGTCAPGEQCRYVDVYDRYLCLRPCDSTLGCADLGVECCGGGEDGGPAGYCQPKDQCDWLSAGNGDAGWDGGVGSDGGAGSDDAGTDAGQGGTDAGSGADAGTSVDAG
ncbi:MAG TPA: endonuclease, partial [Hyalangium sp.]|nr:endonuclease [Hyalangium sp.]